MESEFGLLPNEKSEIDKRKDFASLIARVSGTNSPGFDYECYASLTLAEEMCLDKVAIVDENGLTVNLSTNTNGNEVSAKVFVDESVNALSDYYERNGITIKNKQKVNENDIHRFNHVLSKTYFKSGRSSTTDSFTLKGIKEDKITKAGKYVRIGGYILPIEYDTYKENLHKRINKKDLKAFRLVLTGNIKTHY